MGEWLTLTKCSTFSGNCGSRYKLSGINVCRYVLLQSQIAFNEHLDFAILQLASRLYALITHGICI